MVSGAQRLYITRRSLTLKSRLLTLCLECNGGQSVTTNADPPTIGVLKVIYPLAVLRIEVPSRSFPLRGWGIILCEFDGAVPKSVSHTASYWLGKQLRCRCRVGLAASADCTTGTYFE